MTIHHDFYDVGCLDCPMNLVVGQDYEVLRTTVRRADTIHVIFSHTVRSVSEAEIAEAELLEELCAIASGYG